MIVGNKFSANAKTLFTGPILELYTAHRLGRYVLKDAITKEPLPANASFLAIFKALYHQLMFGMECVTRREEQITQPRAQQRLLFTPHLNENFVRYLFESSSRHGSCPLRAEQ